MVAFQVLPSKLTFVSPENGWLEYYIGFLFEVHRLGLFSGAARLLFFGCNWIETPSPR